MCGLVLALVASSNTFLVVGLGLHVRSSLLGGLFREWL